MNENVSTNPTVLDGLNAHIQAFNKLTLEDSLYAYQLPEILLYLTSKTTFSLELKKEKGKGILYGKDHVALRQSFLNDLPKPTRLDLITDKFRELELFSALEKEGIVSSNSILKDVEDIGMGHSVYRLKFEEEDIVIKSLDRSYTQFYSRLLNTLSFPTFPVYTIHNEHGSWEVTPYLGRQTLNDHLMYHKTCSDDLLIQLARSAALGDLFGRGDRHFENYIVEDETIYPLDISFLFWKGNEDWVETYIQGGMAEYSVMSLFLEDLGELYQKMTLFWDVYSSVWETVIKKKRAIQLLIEDHQDLLPEDAFEQLSERLKQKKDYLKDIQRTYNRGLKRLLDLKVFKDRLIEAVKADPNILSKNPLLKMYYLADKDRMNTFFLLDKLERNSILGLF